MILINKINNSTISDAALPVWTGPSSTDIWIQTLVYTSLSTILLADFGIVLCKQWLGHFKTSRSGRESSPGRRKQGSVIGRIKILVFQNSYVQSSDFAATVIAVFWCRFRRKHLHPTAYCRECLYWNHGARCCVLYVHCSCLVDVARMSIPDANIDHSSMSPPRVVPNLQTGIRG